MSENSKVKLIKALDVTDLSGEKVMIDFTTGKYFVLVGAGNDIWEMLESAKPEAITIGQIKSNLLDIYEVDEATCLNETVEFLTKMKSNEFIEVID